MRLGRPAPMNGKQTRDTSLSAAFLELAIACSRPCANAVAFEDLVRTHVKPLLRHRFSIAALGSLSFDHLSIKHMVGVD
jgi:hypothetical protein